LESERAIEMAAASVSVQDIDKGYDPEGGETLDQYRERVLRDATQPGFGNAGKAAETTPAPATNSPPTA
jgi:hypothetical protein